MLSIVYRRFLLGVSMSISLLLLASPASAMCVYNKTNLNDISPEGYHASVSDRIGFNLRPDKNYIISHYYGLAPGEHQCYNDGVKVDVCALFDDLSPCYTMGGIRVERHGYLVATTEPMADTSPHLKHFKFIVRSYSKSNAVKQSVVRKYKCSTGAMGFVNCDPQ